MRVGVGFSENPDTAAAGGEAAREALKRAGMTRPCDFVLLFATEIHNPQTLRAAVAGVVGPDADIIGGGAMGVISSGRFGYYGDQIALAAFWLSGVRCELVLEELGRGSGEAAGGRLGERLAGRGVAPDSPLLLFYDSINDDQDSRQMVMATDLLRGMERKLGFLPDIMGAGLMGEMSNPVMQWTGKDVRRHTMLALLFSGDLRIDHTIMHGCRPGSGYYTVTKADRQTILEINGRPALEFIDTVLDSAIPPENFPFFLIFGVNFGKRWGKFDEKSYASRLCFGIDQERGGIVMFEPDMVEGTQFQIMYRSLELDYMAPRIEKLFNGIEGREPVFAFYINCAGRAAGYAGLDMEDAVVVQELTAGRAPLLGIYTGVEIASVEGRPRGLDWTGVFCLFSVPK